jgi:hypothetical protein
LAIFFENESYTFLLSPAEASSLWTASTVVEFAPTTEGPAMGGIGDLQRRDSRDRSPAKRDRAALTLKSADRNYIPRGGGVPFQALLRLPP